MMVSKSTLLVAAAAGTLVLAAGDTSNMGPTALMWPPDRVWTSEADNIAPCGSPAGPGNRTQFPLTGGKIALVGQDQAWNVQVSVSFMQDPKTNDDFSVLLPPTSLADLDPGHLCIPVPDPPAFAGAVDGTNATLQIKYLAVFDMPGVNQTFYACSDIIYVNPARFSTFVPCFNSSNFDQQPSATPVPAAPSAGGSKSGLSGGAVAGIVIGVVAGLSALAAAAFFWRKKQRSALRARMDASLRGVRWEDQFASGGRRDPPVPKPVSRSSSGSIGLQAMPK